MYSYKNFADNFMYYNYMTQHVACTSTKFHRPPLLYYIQTEKKHDLVTNKIDYFTNFNIEQKDGQFSKVTGAMW